MPPRRPCLTASGERLTAFAAAVAPAPSHPLVRRKQHGEPRLRLEGRVGGEGPGSPHHRGSGCRLRAVPGPRGRAHPPSVVAEPGRQRLFQTAREAGAGRETKEKVGSEEGDGGAQQSGWSAPVPAGKGPGVSPRGRTHTAWDPVTQGAAGSRNQERCRRRDAPASLPAWQLPGRVKAAACRFSLPRASCFPGGTSSGSGNREFYSGCSSECTKGKGFRSRSQKLPHFSLSQMMVSAFGVGGQAGVLGDRQEVLPAAGGW